MRRTAGSARVSRLYFLMTMDEVNTLMLFIYLYFLSNVRNVRCVTFHYSLKRIAQTNDNRFSTCWKSSDIEINTRSTWFPFELILNLNLNFLDFYEKPRKLIKVCKNCFDEQEKSWTYLKIFRKKKLQKHLSRFRLFKT